MRAIFKENLERVCAKIESAAKTSGRDTKDVTLVAVSKYVDVETTREMVEAGHLVLGESRPQQLWEKAERLKEYPIEWHLIGHLQRNKVNRTIPNCTMIHSVDTNRLLNSISNAAVQAELVSCCLLEINISGEEAKHGFRPDEIEHALEVATELPNIKICGFMGMGGLLGGKDENQAEFARLRELRDQHQSFKHGNVDLQELSMGMSGDFELAIAEGATIVRIGSTLFEGAR